MKSGRYFVTYATILVIATAVVYNEYRVLSTTSQGALVEEGNAKIKEAFALQADMKAKFGIFSGALDHQGWGQLARADRREIEGLLAHYLQVVNRILEIESKRNITVDHREQLIRARDLAQAYQRSLENFEQVNGRAYQPKRHGLEATLHTQNAADLVTQGTREI